MRLRRIQENQLAGKIRLKRNIQDLGPIMKIIGDNYRDKEEINKIREIMWTYILDSPKKGLVQINKTCHVKITLILPVSCDFYSETLL